MHASRLLLVLAVCATANAQVGLWSQLQFPTSPSGRYGCQMVYDAARDRMVLFSGTTTGANALQETWENDGTTWTSRGNVGPAAPPETNPSVRGVYDASRQRVVAVLSGSSTFQLWEWNGTTWSQRTTPATPPGRFEFALAYDSVRQRTILHGGRSGSLGVMADTWEFDGTTWTQRSSGGPQNRMQHAMVFDAARGVTVMFGGHRDISPPAQFGDTWVWNGSAWSEYFGITGPAARSSVNMVWDSRRQRVVLRGGRAVYGGGGSYNDTWEWNGQQWTDMQATRILGNNPAMAFDTLRGRAIAFGGNPNGTPSDQTWSYFGTSAPVASIAAYGTGCAGPAGVPSLSVLGGVPRLGTSIQLHLANLPSGLFNLPLAWLGFDNSQWNGTPLPLALDAAGFPGCTALLAPEQAFSFTNVSGVATWSIDVPFLPSLEGLPFYLQGGVFVPGFNTGGLVFSNGLAAVIGR
jgi:hypothetical protein